MSNVVLVLTRVGFYGLENERTRSQAWTFNTKSFTNGKGIAVGELDLAEQKLKSLYCEELVKASSGMSSEKLVPKTILTSFYDAEHWQFKIIGDDAMTIGFIMIGQKTDDESPDLFGANQGPDMEA